VAVVPISILGFDAGQQEDGGESLAPSGFAVATKTCRHECRHGTQECVRHVLQTKVALDARQMMKADSSTSLGMTGWIVAGFCECFEWTHHQTACQVDKRDDRWKNVFQAIEGRVCALLALVGASGSWVRDSLLAANTPKTSFQPQD
jgi:hypothetical protein